MDGRLRGLAGRGLCSPSRALRNACASGVRRDAEALTDSAAASRSAARRSRPDLCRCSRDTGRSLPAWGSADRPSGRDRPTWSTGASCAGSSNHSSYPAESSAPRTGDEDRWNHPGSSADTSRRCSHTRGTDDREFRRSRRPAALARERYREPNCNRRRPARSDRESVPRKVFRSSFGLPEGWLDAESRRTPRETPAPVLYIGQRIRKMWRIVVKANFDSTGKLPRSCRIALIAIDYRDDFGTDLARVLRHKHLSLNRLYRSLSIGSEGLVGVDRTAIKSRDRMIAARFRFS